MTAVQKKCLVFIKFHGRCMIRYGYKSTTFHERDPLTGGPMIACALNVLQGLERRRLIEPVSGHAMVWQLKPPTMFARTPRTDTDAGAIIKPWPPPRTSLNPCPTR